MSLVILLLTSTSFMRHSTFSMVSGMELSTFLSCKQASLSLDVRVVVLFVDGCEKLHLKYECHWRVYGDQCMAIESCIKGWLPGINPVEDWRNLGF